MDAQFGNRLGIVPETRFALDVKPINLPCVGGHTGVPQRTRRT